MMRLGKFPKCAEWRKRFEALEKRFAELEQHAARMEERGGRVQPDLNQANAQVRDLREA